MTIRLTGARRALTASLVLALGASTATATTESTGAQQRVSAWITGYSYWDNSPPGSATIARPVVHDRAGGTGTYDDPITIAVGHGRAGWHYAPGTRIYLESLRKYAVVEDLCGACGSNHGGRPHLDLYVGGENTSARAASSCARSITAVQSIVVNPKADYPVAPGEVADTCGAD